MKNKYILNSKNFKENKSLNEGKVDGREGWKPSTTGSDELDSKIKEL